MKKLLSAVVFLFVLVLSVSLCYASSSALQGENEKEGKGKEVTKFLGIPVDGSKAEMVRKLQAKGFKYDSETELLFGEFNNSDVGISIQTNKNKVWRLNVLYRMDLDEGDAIRHFNRLLMQFEENDKYLGGLENKSIPTEENISYEMRIKNRRYDAYFFQLPDGMNKEMREVLKEKELDKIEEVVQEITSRMVWFFIGEKYGKYYITIYYENKHNASNGSDL